MKILEINKFNFIQGGADRHFLDVIDLLESKGQEVAEFSMENPKNRYSQWNKYFVSYVGYSRSDNLWSKIKGACTRLYSLEAKRKIAEILDDFRPDIAHIHNIYHQISPSILSEIKKRNIPVVMTVHDNKLVYPHYLPNIEKETIGRFKFCKYVFGREFKGSFIKSLLTAVEYKIYNFFNLFDKYIDLYISPSKFTKSKLVQGGIKEEKIIVLPHFIPDDNLDPVFQYTRANTNGKKYALYLGRISKEKGVDKLIKIFKNLPEINLYLAGKIEDDLEITESENIKHLGFQDGKSLKMLIRNSLFVVSASELLETFGLAVIEANICGKPFIGLENGAYRDIVKDCENGFLAKNEKEFESIVREIISGELMFDEEKIKKMTRERFDPEKYYRELISIFSGLTSLQFRDKVNNSENM